MTIDRVSLGKSGETLACRELERRGYAILARRFRTRVGELDIVARDAETLVFVEVKARRTLRSGAPAESVTDQKQRKLVRMAEEYLLRCHVGAVRCRFDVVSVVLPGEESITGRVEIIRNAFELSR